MNYIEFQLERAAIAIGVSGDTPYLGEAITQFEHGQQAAFFAEKQGHSNDVMLAALLHDIGHYAYRTQQPQMGEFGAINHEWIGAKLAKEIGLSNKIARLIGYHVDAKRYLASRRPRYQELLSDASKQTLLHQGGAMTEGEMKNFEELADFNEILQVRTNDEKAKVVNLDIPDFGYYIQKLHSYLLTRNIKAHHKQNITILSSNIDYSKLENLELKQDYDIILCVPFPETLKHIKHIFANNDSLVIPDYFFTAGLDDNTLKQLGITFGQPINSLDEYIAEFLSFVEAGCLQSYLLVVAAEWFTHWQEHLELAQNNKFTDIQISKSILTFNIL